MGFVDAIIALSLDQTFRVDKNTNIQKWGYVLQNKLPGILTGGLVFDHEIRVSPWKNWIYEQYTDRSGALRYRLKNTTKTPEWWNAYNAVKHQRTTNADTGHINYTKANLINLINSFGALYLLESEYMQTLEGEQEPIDGIGNSQAFQMYFPMFEDLIY